MPTKDGNRLKAPVHDKFFYDAVLSDDQAVALLLKSLLPARIVERIDWAAGPERPADRLTTKAGASLIPDCWLRFPMKEGRRVSFIIEHKSDVDPRTPFQLMRYTTEIVTASARGRSGRPVLAAPVVSLVVSHANRPWDLPRLMIDSMEHLAGHRSAEAGEVRLVSGEFHRQADPREAGMGYFVADLFSMRLADMPSDPVLRGVLAALKCSGKNNIGDEWTAAIAGMFKSERLFTHAALYVGEELNCDPKRIALELERLEPNGKEKMMGKLKPQFEKWVLEDERLKGNREGRQEGRKEGRQEGMAELILELLQDRYGKLPDWARAKLGQAESSDLKKVGTAAMREKSLEAVFTAAGLNPAG